MSDLINNDELPIAVATSSLKMLEDAKKAAISPATVLLEGETGTGKEVLAHYIHKHSDRAEKMFISVNCAALPDNMIEAILFGHEKGAFTGAITTHVGKFEQAHGGTLLLDEISELPQGLQAKLLRVLQERKVERIGGAREMDVDVRVIAATNKDLKKEAEQGRFRKDLFYRLNVIKLQCVPLRDRKEDIIPLTEYFIRLHAAINHKAEPTLTGEAKEKLIAYPWPGNVREIENVVQRLIVMNNLKEITARDLPIENPWALENYSLLENNEAELILDILRETAGCRQAAAKKLNISPRTLRYKISKLKEIGLVVPSRG